MKNQKLAIFFSLLWTGLGQLYAGSFIRGLLLMAATPIVWTLAFIFGPGAIYRSMTGAQNAGAVGVVGVAFTLIPFAFWIWGMVDAKMRCDQRNQELRAFVLGGTPLAPPAV
jgi:TM2 domain-containing membrane protein YozV